MPVQFDPYHKWLGIQADEQPANHYRLMGLSLFEDDIDAIAGAADQRMAHVRTYQLGKHSDLSQKILNELATAKTCLLNPEKKLAYDKQLRKKSKPSLSEAIPVEPAVELDPAALHAAISHTKRRRKGQVSPYGSTFRFVGLAIAGVLGLGTAWQLNSYFNSSNPSGRDTAQAEHNQSARKSDEVNSVVDEDAQIVASKSTGPKKPAEQTGLPMLERSSDPSQSTASTKPAIEAKTSVDIPVTAEKPVIERTLSQEAEELKAVSEAAKSTEDQQAVAEKGLALADRAIVEGNTDLAKTAVRTSLAAARKADDGALTKRATQLLMQMQNPLSESLKDDARRRRGSEKPPSRAAEEPTAVTAGTTTSVVPQPAVVDPQALVFKFDDKAFAEQYWAWNDDWTFTKDGGIAAKAPTNRAWSHLSTRHEYMGNVTIDMEFDLGLSTFVNTGWCVIKVWGKELCVADRSGFHSFAAKVHIHREGDSIVFIHKGKDERISIDPERRAQPTLVDIAWRFRSAHFRLIEIKAENIKPSKPLIH